MMLGMLKKMYSRRSRLQRDRSSAARRLERRDPCTNAETGRQICESGEIVGEIQMSETFKDRDWSILLERINNQRCVPFLGAGASFPTLPLGSTIAADRAREYNYPGDNPKNLVEVAQFLAIMGRDKLLPEVIQRAIARSTCLFIGYRLADWNFRVLFQGLRAGSIAGGSIAVLKPPGDDELAGRQREYLDRYYANIDLKIYWGTAQEFTIELRDRWEKFNKVWNGLSRK